MHFKLYGSTVFSVIITDLIPYHAQVLNIVPKFPGSEIESKITIWLFLDKSPLLRVSLTSAIMPWLFLVSEIYFKSLSSIKSYEIFRALREEIKFLLESVSSASSVNQIFCISAFKFIDSSDEKIVVSKELKDVGGKLIF